MKEVYVKAKDLGSCIEYLPNQDIFSLDEIIGAFEELLYEYQQLEEKFEDYKENVEDTMQPRTHWSPKEVSMYNANN